MHAALAGTLAGLLHVVSGPDHLVAVAPLAMKRPLSGLRIGVTWGIGHATGVILVGLLGVLLRTFVDVDSLSKWAEFVVGFVLIGVGVWAIAQMRKIVLHRHEHQHAANSMPPTNTHAAPNEATRDALSGSRENVSATPASNVPGAHAHIHVHHQGEPHDVGAHRRHHSRGSYWVGLIHGAAGTGHLLGVLPSLALPPKSGVVYLGCYGIAAVIAMGGFGMVMGIIGYRLRPQVLRSVMLACGILAIGLGLFWIASAWPNVAASGAVTTG